MVRALLFHHPSIISVGIDDEYYFGSEFLVCPVMNSENKRDIYLPEGLWVNFLQASEIKGAVGTMT